MYKTLRLAFLLAGLSFLLTGCEPAGTSGSRDRSQPIAGDPSVGFSLGSRAPDIEGVDADGRRFKLSDYRGQVVLLEFWSST